MAELFAGSRIRQPDKDLAGKQENCHVCSDRCIPVAEYRICHHAFYRGDPENSERFI